MSVESLFLEIDETMELDIRTAKRIINRLKAGTTPIDCVQHVNVGNERWFHAASEFFDLIQSDDDSLVRFVKGYYGDGKTHFLGMLRSMALGKNWAVSYVSAENTPLNKFELVYSEITKNISLSSSTRLLSWVAPDNTRGGMAVLAAIFSKIYLDSYRPGDESGLQKASVMEAVNQRANNIATFHGIHELVGYAFCGFVNAIFRNDMGRIQQIVNWIEGGNTKIPEININRYIDRKVTREIMRSVSLLLKKANVGGILVLLDETERIMEQRKPVRNRSYGILRDILDNADNQGGMTSSQVYVAATPDMFSSEKGFAEYDALRSRLEVADRFNIPNYMDYRSVIIDLPKTPLDHDLLVELGKRIRNIHSISRNWTAEDKISDELIDGVVTRIESGAFQVSKPRMLSASMATLLEIAEQNPTQDINNFIIQTLDTLGSSLSEPPTVAEWE